MRRDTQGNDELERRWEELFEQSYGVLRDEVLNTKWTPWCVQSAYALPHERLNDRRKSLGIGDSWGL